MQGLRIIENDLVPVYVTSTGEKVVYGTELHSTLKVKSKFADWIKNRLNDCDAVEKEDFESFSKNLENGGRIKEYIIKLDTAKEMAMLEHNSKGKNVRRYFINIEKKYKEENPKPKLEDINKAAEILENVYRDAGADKRYIALLIGGIYKENGLNIQLPPVEMDTAKLYDQTMIASELGIMSASGKPHSQAVGAVISMLDISDDDKIMTPYTNNGHSGVNTQYKEYVVDMVKQWLKDNLYPAIIESGNKKYKVNYR